MSAAVELPEDEQTEIVGDTLITPVDPEPESTCSDAWSDEHPEIAEDDDEYAEYDAEERHPWTTVFAHAGEMLVCGVLASLVIAVGAVFVILTKSHRPSPSASPPTVTITMTPPPVTESADPLTVTMKPAPSTHVAVPHYPPFSAVDDQRYLRQMRLEGYDTTNGAGTINAAHQGCRLLQQGDPVGEMELKLAAQWQMTPQTTRDFSTGVLTAYHNCTPAAVTW